MSAKYEQISLFENQSFSIGIFQDNLEKSSWHYHNNFEISFITEGTGKRIVADSMEEFQPGDLVFIGRNMNSHTQKILDALKKCELANVY